MHLENTFTNASHGVHLYLRAVHHLCSCVGVNRVGAHRSFSASLTGPLTFWRAKCLSFEAEELITVCLLQREASRQDPLSFCCGEPPRRDAIKQATGFSRVLKWVRFFVCLSHTWILQYCFQDWRAEMKNVSGRSHPQSACHKRQNIKSGFSSSGETKVLWH